MRRCPLTLVGLMLVVSMTVIAQPRRAARNIPESTPSPEELALQNKLNARVRALSGEGGQGFFPRRTRVEQVKLAEGGVEVFFSDAFGWLAIDEETQGRLEDLLRPELGEGYREAPLRFFLRRMSLEELDWRNELNAIIKEHWKPGFEELFPERTALSDLEVHEASSALVLRFSPQLSWMPLRPEIRDALGLFFRPLVGERCQDYEMRFFIEETPLDALTLQPHDPHAPARVPLPEGPPLVRLAEPAAPVPEAGLYGRHLVVSMSHGWMYDSEKSFRWEWQRARLFNTVEDMHTMSYGVPWLIPMLERAGAVVFHTRERDWQAHEVVLDDGDGRRRRGAGEVRRSGRWKR